jgi:putative transposase
MEVSEAKRLKALEEENAKLKKLLAEQMLDVAALPELLAKNVWSTSSVQGFATAQMTIPVA